MPSYDSVGARLVFAVMVPFILIGLGSRCDRGGRFPTHDAQSVGVAPVSDAPASR